MNNYGIFKLEFAQQLETHLLPYFRIATGVGNINSGIQLMGLLQSMALITEHNISLVVAVMRTVAPESRAADIAEAYYKTIKGELQMPSSSGPIRVDINAKLRFFALCRVYKDEIMAKCSDLEIPPSARGNIADITAALYSKVACFGEAKYSQTGARLEAIKAKSIRELTSSDRYQLAVLWLSAHGIYADAATLNEAEIVLQ